MPFLVANLATVFAHVCPQRFPTEPGSMIIDGRPSGNLVWMWPWKNEPWKNVLWTSSPSTRVNGVGAKGPGDVSIGNDVVAPALLGVTGPTPSILCDSMPSTGAS